MHFVGLYCIIILQCMVQKKKEEEENMKLHARSYIRISTSPQRRQRP